MATVKRSRKPRQPPGALSKNLGFIFVILKILVVYAIPGLMFVGVIYGMSFLLPLVVVTAQSAAALLVGNTILNAAHLAGYTSPGWAAIVGAAGGCIGSLIVGLAVQTVPTKFIHEPQFTVMPDGQLVQLPPKVHWYAAIVISALVGTLAGVIGQQILLKHHHPIEIDLLHATRAGALGGAVVGVVFVLIGPLVMTAIGLALRPLWIVSGKGLAWVIRHTKKTWKRRYEGLGSLMIGWLQANTPDLDEEMGEKEQDGKA